jgi:hypothetical protein
MNKSVFTISILIIGLVLLFLFFSILGILYFYWGDAKAVQDSLSTTGGIFGAIATLAAASIAAYLFNDWKEQHNKTILAPEAIEIYKHINADILISAEYISHIKRNINNNLNGFVAIEIFSNFEKFVEIRGERTIALKYFATLAKNEKINKLIYEYAACVEKQLKYLNSTLRNQQTTKQQIVDQQFINNNDSFTKALTEIQLEINKTLSDYIIVK